MKMTRVQKELASLAPWAWDPLVGKHAPGSAMMRDFTEVVADKTVTTNTTSYRFAPETATAMTPGPSAGAAGGGLSYTDGTARKRVRSPPHSHSVFAPNTASKETPVAGGGHAWRATPPTALMGPPPSSGAGAVHTTASKGLHGHRGGGSGAGVDANHGDGGGGEGRAVAITPANLGKALEEAGEVMEQEEARQSPRLVRLQASEKLANEKAASEKLANEKAAREKAASEKAASEKAAAVKEKTFAAAAAAAAAAARKKASAAASAAVSAGLAAAAAVAAGAAAAAAGAAAGAVKGKENVKPGNNSGSGGGGSQQQPVSCGGGAVYKHKLNPFDPHSLNAPGFNPRTYHK
jgi:hypothetical protein